MKSHNPPTIVAPFGAYTHAFEVPPNARFLYMAGQVGVAPDGSCKPDIEGQTDQAWRNIEAILASAGMGVGDIVKVTTFLVNEADMAPHRAVRAKHLGDARPPHTLVVVKALAQPGWLIEVEAIAAKA
jgi:enamine deaminase RidA (YjgF/YER057c/UK114 family)